MPFLWKGISELSKQTEKALTSSSEQLLEDSAPQRFAGDAVAVEVEMVRIRIKPASLRLVELLRFLPGRKIRAVLVFRRAPHLPKLHVSS